MEPSSSPARRRGAIVGAVVLTAGALTAAPFVVRSSYDKQAPRTVATTVPPTFVPTSAPTPTLTPTAAATETETAVATEAADTAGVVPWADLPVDPAGEPSPLPAPTLDPTLLPCAASQLNATAGDQGVTMGQGDTVITIRRVAGAPCLLDDTVTRLSGVTTAGDRESLPTEGLRHRADDIPVDLRGAGDTGNVLLGYFTRCGSEVATDNAGKVFYAPASRPALRDIVLDMRVGGALHVASGALDLGCVGQKVQVSRVGAPPYEPQFAPVGLTASMTVPPTATGGHLLDYVVTLTNTSTHTFSLSPCPNYAQYFKLPPYVAGDQALNCAAARPIPAGGSEAFAMTIPVPVTSEAYGPLIWHLHTGGTESIWADATVSLQGPTGGEPRACVASQLSAVLDGVGNRAAGYEWSTVTITRISGEPCTLRDVVKSIYGSFDGAESTALAISNPGLQDPASVLLDGPGTGAQFDIRVLARCADGPAQRRSSPAKSLRLLLAGTGDLAVSAHTQSGGLAYGCLPHGARIDVDAIATM